MVNKVDSHPGLGSHEAPVITSVTIPEHLRGSTSCGGVGQVVTTGITIEKYIPQFRTAIIHVPCSECHTILKFPVKY